MSEISVIIPTYNPGEYISRCFKSIECQTLAKDRFRVYIALNGSDVLYERYLEELLAERGFNYELFFLPQAGVSNARNFLIEISKEEYVVFIDDDDVISENYLEDLLRVATPTTIGIANVYNFSHSLEDLRESYIGLCYKSLPEITSSKFRARKYFSTPCAKIISRDIIGPNRFDTKLSIGEDSLFMAKISKRVKSLRKTNPSACYYVCEREGSVTRKKVLKKEEVKRILYLLKEYGGMFFSFRYGGFFVLSRFVATLTHFKRLV